MPLKEQLRIFRSENLDAMWGALGALEGSWAKTWGCRQAVGGHAREGSVDTDPPLTAVLPTQGAVLWCICSVVVRRGRAEAPGPGRSQVRDPEGLESEGSGVGSSEDGSPRSPGPATLGGGWERGLGSVTSPPLCAPLPEEGVATGTGRALTAQAADGTQVSPPGVGGAARRGQMVFVVGRKA